MRQNTNVEQTSVELDKYDTFFKLNTKYQYSVYCEIYIFVLQWVLHPVRLEVLTIVTEDYCLVRCVTV